MSLPLHILVDTSKQVGSTRSRLEKVHHLTTCLRQLGRDDVAIGVAYLAGVMPQGRIGIGPSAAKKARPASAASAPTLTLRRVHDTFGAIKAMSGPGSNKARIGELGALLAQGTREEQTFVSRLVMGFVRQGALEGIMAEAIAKTADIESAEVRRAVMVTGDLCAVGVAALLEGRAALARFKVQVFVPLRPMLAHTAEEPADAIERLKNAALEFKMDGARVQVHKQGDDVRVYTRRLHDVSNAVPEIVEATRRLPARELILDGETIAMRSDGAPHTFQTTMRRFGRRLDVEKVRAKLPLSTYFFDCLHADGHTLIDEQHQSRFQTMKALLPNNLVIPHLTTAVPEEADAFFESALAIGHEGIMAKAPTAVYEAGRRGHAWLKVKPAHTLDLIVLAAEWGSGRRQGWLSNLHLGARDPENGGFVMIGKTFKGLTDALLTWQTEHFQKIELSRDDWTVFVRPETVVEIAAGGVQASPHYPGGVALRFARVKRYRADKAANEADTIATVRSIYERTLGPEENAT